MRAQHSAALASAFTKSLLASAERLAIGSGLPTLDEIYERSLSETIGLGISALSASRGLPHSKSNYRNTPAARDLAALVATMSADQRGSNISAQLGMVFEQLRGARLVRVGGVFGLATSAEQRSKGIYYTPAALAEEMALPSLRYVLAPVQTLEDLKAISVLDPAVGCGAFLLASIRLAPKILRHQGQFQYLTEQEIRSEFASTCIYGVDLDPLAVATARALICAEVGDPEFDSAQLDAHLHVGDAVASRLQEWREWFPERSCRGFSLVMTNPPWSKLRPLRHEFFEHIDRRVRHYQGSELGRFLAKNLPDLVSGSWSEYVDRTLKMSRELSSSTEYELNSASAGDPDLYKYFVERSIDLIGEGGAAALLLPSGVLRAQGSAVLRRMLRERGRVLELTEYINKRKIFDIHSMYRFCSVLFRRGQPGGIDRGRFAVEQVGAEIESLSVDMSLEFLSSVGGAEALIPELRNADEQRLMAGFYERFPSIEGNGSWNLRFRRELDMTNDSAAFVEVADAKRRGFVKQLDGRWRSTDSGETLLPVYEGRMVHQFDSSAKTHVAGQGRSAVWSVPRPLDREIRPHYLVSEHYASSRGWTPNLRAAYCEISGHANERTILAALIPKYSVCGNKVLVLRSDHLTLNEHHLWLSLANSLVVDWLMRRWVSTSVNQFFWRNIPLPPRAMNSRSRLLIDASKAMNEQSHIRSDRELLGRRSLLRAAIDATVFELYGVNEIGVSTIMRDFPAFGRAHVRRGASGISSTELIRRARAALKAGLLELDDLERCLECPADSAWAAYTPNAQAGQLLLGSADDRYRRTGISSRGACV